LAQTGFHGGVRFAHTLISWDDTTFDENDENGTGPGIGIAVGYGFNPLLTMMVSLSAHTLNSGKANTQYAEILGRFHLGQTRFQPYLEAGVMGSLFRYDDIDVRFSGPGIVAGAGLKAAISDKLSLELGVRPARSIYDKIRSGRQSNEIEDVKTWQIRSYVGISVYID
jgi:opacity protein-like surface antigen